MKSIAFTRTGAAVVAVLMLAGSAASIAHAGTYEWRTIDGSGNNLMPGNTLWGAAHTQIVRLSPHAYGPDGSTPSGTDRPNPRTISNLVVQQPGSIVSARGLSDMVWQWGQFIDHDLSLSPDSTGEQFNIVVPSGDPVFPNGSTIPLFRSAYDPSTGTGSANPRQQINSLTSWIDGSMVYGSDASRANWLRDPDPSNKGMLKVIPHALGDFMPVNDGSQPNGGGNGSNLFVAGDTRANEQVGLISIHTLFVREHNRLAGEIAAANPGLSSDEVYERARRIVGAQTQAITYNEFLPALLGDGYVPSYTGYDASVDPSVRNEFSSAIFRIGHTMLSPELQRLDADWNSIPEGPLSLRDAFFRPDRVINEGGIDPILRGLVAQTMQEIDVHIVEDVRSFLFGPPGAGGLDLAALNIQRGREHGLADYNTIRQAYGLSPVSTFDDISSDPDIVMSLRAAYGQTGGVDNVHLVDLWIGALAEDHLPGSSVGELMMTGLIEQFTASRVADRFYYEIDSDLHAILAEIGMSLNDLEARLLSDIIMDNTGITGLHRNVFFVIPAPTTPVVLLAGMGFFARRRRA